MRSARASEARDERQGSPAADPFRRPWARQLALVLGYIAAGIIVSLPRSGYPATRDPAGLDGISYIWDFWWVAHQVTHLGNPWQTGYLAAPAGMWLGFDTLLPLPAAVMTPVTLAFGPDTSFYLLMLVTPGLCCYTAYRAARLWISSAAGAICAGGFYGLATMLVYQDWIHLNIALGAIFPPLALEAAVRLRRRPGYRLAALAGLVVGACALVNQESATQAAIVAGLTLLPWLARQRSMAKLRLVAVAALTGVAVASPQIAAMLAQKAAGQASFPPRVLASWDATFGVPLGSLFSPSPRLATFHLGALAAGFHYVRSEGIPAFGIVLTIAALIGLAAGWRDINARLLALGWAGAAALSLGAVTHPLLFGVDVHGVRMSGLMPYTWLVQVPGLSAFREADRWALLGLVPAALLAGYAVDWLWRRPARLGTVPSRLLLAVLLAAAALEAGFSAPVNISTLEPSLPRLAAPIAADHSRSIVVDVPYGIRGVMPWGSHIVAESLLLPTEDGHPTDISYTSWAPAATVAALKRHPFYRNLTRAQSGQPWNHTVAADRRDAQRMGVRWAVVWQPTGGAVSYLRALGFSYGYRVGTVSVYRLAPRGGCRRLRHT